MGRILPGVPVAGAERRGSVGAYGPGEAGYILITDINMPYIGGVELLEMIQKKYPDVVTFVVSGYDDFEYVKGTFMSGAINYLIKPVTKIDFVNAIVNALGIIGEHENEKQELLKAASLIQDREYSQLIDREEEAYASGISMDGGMCLILVKIHNYYELVKESQYDMNRFSLNIKEEIRRLSGEKNMTVFNHVFRSNEFIILSDAGNKELVKLAKKIKIHFDRESDACLTFAISAHSCTIDSVRMAYVEAVALLMTRSYRRKNEILVSGTRDNQEKEACMNIRFSAAYENRVKSKGKATALKAGKGKTVKITAMATDGSGKKKTVKIKIKQHELGTGHF